MEGFLVIDYLEEFASAKAQLQECINEGKISYKEDIQHGFENMPKTLMRLFDGQNFGKQLLKVAEKTQACI